MSPQIRGKVRLHAGGIKAGRHSPIPGFVAVNAMHRFGISPPKCASATGSPVCAGWLALAWLGSSEKMKESQ
jgi:hypothetical protein